MRYVIVAVCLLLSLATPTLAVENTPRDVKGLYLLTDYPAITVRPGTTSHVNLRLQNYALAPERLALTVSGVPAGWTATLVGGGQPIAAAMPATDQSVTLELRLEVPKGAAIGSHTLTINADGGNTHARLPLAVTLAKDLPAKLSLQPQLPQLRGSSRASFEYTLSIKNDSGKKLLVSLAAQAPRNFDATFTEAYGSQELSAIPVDAGQSKDVKLKVRPPNTIGAGHYEVIAKIGAEDASASTKLGLDITGEAKLDISGRDGRVSGRATAGKEATLPVVVSNSGTAPAQQVQLSGSGPNGWKVTFEPKIIDHLAPNQSKEVQASITPPSKAIAGDYVTVLSASARGESASSNFRITVSTSTLWGIAGVGIIGAALLVMVGAVARFGRR